MIINSYILLGVNQSALKTSKSPQIANFKSQKGPWPCLFYTWVPPSGAIVHDGCRMFRHTLHVLHSANQLLHVSSIFSFPRQLENDLQNKQLGGNFPRKQQTTPEKSERHGHSREDERVENRAGSARELIHHRAQVCWYSSLTDCHADLVILLFWGSCCTCTCTSRSTLY